MAGTQRFGIAGLGAGFFTALLFFVFFTGLFGDVLTGNTGL